MQGHMNVKFITMQGHMNVKFEMESVATRTR